MISAVGVIIGVFVGGNQITVCVLVGEGIDVFVGWGVTAAVGTSILRQAETVNKTRQIQLIFLINYR